MKYFTSSLVECRAHFADMRISCDHCELLWDYDELVITANRGFKGYLTDIDDRREFETCDYVENHSATACCPICSREIADFNWS